MGQRARPNLEFRAEEATRLSFADDEFDLAAAIEVLEHVPEPEATLAEMARVARRHLLVSVPREPLWRGLNMARGAYCARSATRPGHVNHWSKRSFVSLLSRHGEVEEARSPFPWTMLLVRVGSSSRATGAAPRSSRSGSAPPGWSPSPTSRSPATRCRSPSTARITLLWSAVFITVSVLYRPVEQLLSRTIADRDARGHRRQRAPAGGGHDPAGARQSLFAVVALALRGPIQDDLFGGSATLYWILIAAVLAYAASYFARGFLAGHRRFGLYGGLVLMESCSRCLFALAVAVGIAEGQSAVALGMVAAPLVSLAVVPCALGRRLAPAPLDGAGCPDPALDPAAAEPGPEPEFTLAHGTGFAVAVLLDHAGEQTFLNAGPLLVKAHRGRRGRGARRASPSTCC